MSSSFAKTASWRLASVVSSIAANLLILRLCDRHLGGGVLALVYASITVLTYLPILDGGFRMTLNRELLRVREHRDKAEWVAFGQSLYWIIGLVGMVVGTVVLTAYGATPGAGQTGLGLSFFAALGIAGGLSFLANSQANALIGLGWQWKMFGLNTAMVWLNLALLAFGFSRGWSAWAFPFALAGVAIIQIPLAWRMVKSASPDVGILGSGWGPAFRAKVETLWDGSMAALRNQVFTALLYSVDILLVTWLVARAEQDAYSVAARIFAIVRVTLQAADEAMWPRVAADREIGGKLALALTRVNAWLYGAVMAALALTLIPFLKGLVTPERVPTIGVAGWMAARWVITGLCSQPAYFLYGDGKFEKLGRFMGLELFGLLILSIPLASRFGATGLAAAGCLATGFGTLVFLPAAYAEAARLKFLDWWGGIWFRALAAGAMAAGWVWLGRGIVSGPWATGWVGFFGAGLALLVGWGVRWAMRWPKNWREAIHRL